MKSSNSILIDIEIKELIKKGWANFPCSESNLYIAVLLQDSKVSFPHESYDLQKGNEELSGIWVKWRAEQIVRLMKFYGCKLIWEVGSGHGNVAIPLQHAGIAVIGIEPLKNGATITAKNGVKTYLGTLESLSFPSNSISAVGAFDVLEHLETPEKLLSEIHRVLKPGGLLFTSVPAHQWLFSDFDKSIGHYQRYSRGDLAELLETSKFSILSTEFIFSIFVLPAMLLRKLPYLFGQKSTLKKTLKSAKHQRRLINIFEPFLIILLRLEKLINLPLGLSLLSVSQKSYSE